MCPHLNLRLSLQLYQLTSLFLKAKMLLSRDNFYTSLFMKSRELLKKTWVLNVSFKKKLSLEVCRPCCRSESALNNLGPTMCFSKVHKTICTRKIM